MPSYYGPDLERKFVQINDAIEIGEDASISGYASLFGKVDQGRDVVIKGAYASSLKRLAVAGTKVKLLWQHDPAQPIGVWDEVFEDGKGLFVRGRLLTETRRGREAAALIAAGAIDGLSIGYRTIKADRKKDGSRHLSELELWEVSLVTFPMLHEARVGANTKNKDDLGQDLAGVFRTLRHTLGANWTPGQTHSADD